MHNGNSKRITKYLCLKLCKPGSKQSDVYIYLNTSMFIARNWQYLRQYACENSSCNSLLA